MKGTGECVYTGFELTFGKTKNVSMGAWEQILDLVEVNTTMITCLLFIVLYVIYVFVNLKKETKNAELIIKMEIIFTIILSVEIYLLEYRANYTASSIPVENLEMGFGAKVAVVLCVVSTVCLFVRGVFFREKKQK